MSLSGLQVDFHGPIEGRCGFSDSVDFDTGRDKEVPDGLGGAKPTDLGQ
jgi:hypothetical protein